MVQAGDSSLVQIVAEQLKVEEMGGGQSEPVTDKLDQVGVVTLDYVGRFAGNWRGGGLARGFGRLGIDQTSDWGKHGFFVDCHTTLCIAFAEMDGERRDDSDTLVDIHQFRANTSVLFVLFRKQIKLETITRPARPRSRSSQVSHNPAPYVSTPI